MGIDRNRFRSDIEDDYICLLCNKVFEDPVAVNNCLHSFCRRCIEQWMKRRTDCPNKECRQKFDINDLKTIPLLVKMLSRLQLTCQFSSLGCDQVIAWSSLSFHTAECRHNPDLTELCDGGCGSELTKKQVTNHRCVESLNQKMVVLKKELKKCQSEKEEIVEKLDELKETINDKFKTRIDALEKIINEKFEELEIKKEAKIQEKYKDWLLKFYKPNSLANRQYVDRLKEKQLITDWKTEEVVMRCWGGYQKYSNLGNWFLPKVLLTLKDNLELGSCCFIDQSWEYDYLIKCFSYMVGPKGRVYTNFYFGDIKKRKDVEPNIFRGIAIDFKNKLLSINNDSELSCINFDCMIFGTDYPVGAFVDRLKPGGRIIYVAEPKIQIHGNYSSRSFGSIQTKQNYNQLDILELFSSPEDNSNPQPVKVGGPLTYDDYYINFFLIEKLMDGTIKESEVKQ